MIFTQALTRPNALWHILMRNFKIDPVPLHQSKSFCNVVSFLRFKSVILLWTLVIQSVLSQEKKKEPPHSFHLDHCFGTAGLLTQLPLATNIKKNPLGHLTAKAEHFQHIIIIQPGTVLTVQSHARAHSWHIPFLSYRSLLVTGEKIVAGTASWNHVLLHCETAAQHFTLCLAFKLSSITQPGIFSSHFIFSPVHAVNSSCLFIQCYFQL